MRRQRAMAVLVSAVVAVAMLAGGAGHAVASKFLLPVPEGDLTWSPDSRLLAMPETKAISLLRTDGGVERRLRGPGIDYFSFPCLFCPLGWTEDSSRILYISEEEEMDSEGSVVGSVAADGSAEEVRSLSVPIGSATWAPTGWPLIYIPNSRAWFSGTKGKRVGPNPDLWRLDSLYAKPRKLIASRAEEEDPLFSPDGAEITFMRSNERSTSLWKASADGTGSKRLVNNLLGPSAAAWSPDGRRIALSTYSRAKGDRRCHLYMTSPNGGQLRQIVDEEILTERPAWTPDGHWITFSTSRGEIRKVRPDGTGLQTIASFPGKEVRGLSWSPDGRHLTYSAQIPPRSD